MLINKKKKGELPIGIISTIILLLIFAAIYMWSNKQIFTRSTTDIKNKINDDDNDGVLNIADKCPCPEKQGQKRADDLQNDGCPLRYKITNSGKGIEDRSCLTKIV